MKPRNIGVLSKCLISPLLVAAVLFINLAPHADRAVHGGETEDEVERPFFFDAEKPPGVVWYGVNLSDMRTFDPHFATRAQFMAAANLLFNRLIRVKPGVDNELEPDLAENIPEPKIMDGRQVWTFRLKSGVMFHEGPDTPAYELTADDVVYSLKKTIYQVSPTYAGDFSGMSVAAADNRTVRITLEKPMTPLLFLTRFAQYSGGYIISKKAFAVQGADGFKKHPVGTGPFQFGGRTPGEKVSFIAHRRYFRGSPKISGIDFLFVPRIEDRNLGIKSGKLDIIDGVHDIDQLKIWEGSDDFVVDFSGVGEASMLHFNTKFKPMNDPAVRKAIAYALDRDEFEERFGSKMISPIFSPAPAEYLIGGLEQSRIAELELDYRRDIDRARALLSEAGYPDGFSMKLVSSEMPVYRHYYESMCEQLSRIGIVCDIEIVRHPVMHVKIRKSMTPLVIYIAWRPDADANLTRFFHSDSIMVTGARPDTNFAHYKDLDKLIEAGRYAAVPEKQIKLWKYAQIKVLDDMVVYPLHYMSPIHIRNKNLDYGCAPSSQYVYPPVSEKTKRRAP